MAHSWIYRGLFVAALLIDGFFAAAASFCKMSVRSGNSLRSGVIPASGRESTKPGNLSVVTRHSTDSRQVRARGCELRLFQLKKERQSGLRPFAWIAGEHVHTTTLEKSLSPQAARSLWIRSSTLFHRPIAAVLDLAVWSDVLVLGAFANALEGFAALENFLNFERLDFGITGRPFELAIFLVSRSA